MQSGAVPFVIYEMTHSASWVGVAGSVPSMLCTLAGGALADRCSKATIDTKVDDIDLRERSDRSTAPPTYVERA